MFDRLEDTSKAARWFNSQNKSDLKLNLKPSNLFHSSSFFSLYFLLFFILIPERIWIIDMKKPHLNSATNHGITDPYAVEDVGNVGGGDGQQGSLGDCRGRVLQIS